MSLSAFLQYAVSGLAILVGSASFSIIFRIRLRLFPAAAFGGFLAWLVWVISKDAFAMNDFTSNLTAALIVTGYSEVMARFFKTPSTVFLTLAILPLVPGSAIYSTMVCLVGSDKEGLALYGTRTLQVAVGIAAGVIIASIIGTFFRPLRPSFKNKSKQ